MNAQEVRDLSDDELNTKLIDLKKEQFNLRFQRASGQLEKTDRVQEVRRTIARIKTLQSERRKNADAPARSKPEEVKEDGNA
ncbi:50S ribosomal protein L29 [Parvularcula sp. ZS-1/3]|uniref:Large ribosomal subunit protein uL29 n=1 Tax=Parvularcula mediterranea TaxID=2732508 RepID=A0A7Y3W436_9PROT|nr:50S ribosomal protein L29 [Parvularcula mediterranea]NNU14842.1 50S ribosomal protein L29 [Parvularcula mediterranea]